MIKHRKASPSKQGEETLLDMIISYSEYEDLQHADALQFTTAGQYTVEYGQLFLYARFVKPAFNVMILSICP